MKYSEIKTILYNSEAITNIPDRWEESIPFVSVVNGKEMDTFLYWNTCKMLEIKLMIAIDKITGALCVFNKDNIREIYPSLSLIFSPIIINDYDEYFSAKRIYEELYEKMCLSKDNYEKFGAEALYLFKKILGKDLFENFFSIIAKEYIDELTFPK